MNRDQRIKAILSAEFAPTELVVTNNSHEHAGHSGSPNTGSSHYEIVIKSKKFTGLNKVSIHRLINKALQPEFESGMHALAIRASD